jgi:hypothetical protein
VPADRPSVQPRSRTIGYESPRGGANPNSQSGRVFYRTLATGADSDDWPDLAFSLPNNEQNDPPIIEVGPEQEPRRQRLVLPTK